MRTEMSSETEIHHNRLTLIRRPFLGVDESVNNIKIRETEVPALDNDNIGTGSKSAISFPTACGSTEYVCSMSGIIITPDGIGSRESGFDIFLCIFHTVWEHPVKFFTEWFFVSLRIQCNVPQV